jgi:hypothetical protein
MKKLVHLGIVAILAITVSSCSKSTNELVVTEKESIKASRLPNQGMNSTFASENFVDGMTKFFPFINQPFDLELANPDSYLQEGEFPVIYVRLAPAFAIDPPGEATLTTSDDGTGLDIQAYSLISYTEADSYGLKIPEGLNGQPFMFAIVELTPVYSGKVVALHSEITVNGETSVSQLDHAFTVIPN